MTEKSPPTIIVASTSKGVEAVTNRTFDKLNPDAKRALLNQAFDKVK